jgi:hypothetical protein
MEDKSREYGQQNLTLPHDVVPLPSQGIFYKNKKKSVKVGYLTASDENILMGGGMDLTANLLRAKIYEPDVRIEDLLEGDVEAILIFLRNTSFGPEININATDPKTGKQFTTQISLDELNIMKGDTPSEDGTFETVLPKSGSRVKLKPLTYGEIMELRKFEENYPKGRVVPSVTWRLGKEIVELDGETDKGQIAKSLEIMPIMDSKYIRKYLDTNEPRLDMRREVTTPSGDRLTVNVGFGVEFFRPFFGL